MQRPRLASDFRFSAIAYLALSVFVCCSGGHELTSVVQPVMAAELAMGARFVGQREYRRAALERSLAVRDNGYARERLQHYGLEREWEALPVLNPAVSPVILSREGPGPPGPLAAVWSGSVAWTEAALLELGRRAFEEFPVQREGRVKAALRTIDSGAGARARLGALGLWQDDRERVGGLVHVLYPDGRMEVALTCASCHARIDAAGRLSHGPGSDLDYGALMAAGGAQRQVSRPGLADVTTDALDNPVAFADLRATRHQQLLHHTGNLENSLPALAIRIETLLITNSGARTRPPREVAFALALYIWGLGAPERLAQGPGADIFSHECAGCHSGSSGEGRRITAERVGTDPGASRSSMRGAGGYRVPSLYRVVDRTRLTHEGWPLDIEGFLDPERRAGRAGHRFGLDLPPRERAELVAHLRTM
jgi:hypothetical protein